MAGGKYIYCTISENKDREFGPIGIDSKEVNLLRYKDIAAVVSNTPVISFDRFGKEKLTAYVATHQKVNEGVLKDYDVCPMTFGVIAPNQEEVLSILEKAYFQFKTALKKIEGKVEFAVQIFWDEKKILEELVNTNPEIQKLREASSKKGILALPIKLKLGRLVFQGVETKKRDYIKDVKDFLNIITDDSTLNKLTDKEMLANFSFLIEKTRESEFDRKMQELGKKYENKLRFKYIGPMPPYSFVKINLSLGNFELVNGARELLGLGEEASFDEIKKAYYKLAQKYHPDKHKDDPEIEEKMKGAINAYSILKNYCRSCDESTGKVDPSPLAKGDRVEGRKYSFKEEDVKNSLIIKEEQKWHNLNYGPI